MILDEVYLTHVSVRESLAEGTEASEPIRRSEGTERANEGERSEHQKAKL